MKGGLLVKYTRKDGTEQKGKAMHDDQKPEQMKTKVAVRLVDDKFKETGKNVLVEYDRLNTIGFID